MIDFVVYFGVAAAMMVWAIAISAFVPPGDAEIAVLVLVGMLAPVVLFLIKDGYNGHSFGKCLIGLRVVRVRTLQPIGPGGSVARNGLCLIIPAVIPVMAIQLEEGYHLGDMLAGSKVVWERYAENPVFTELPLDGGAPEEQGEPTPWRTEQPPMRESENPYRAPRP